MTFIHDSPFAPPGTGRMFTDPMTRQTHAVVVWPQPPRMLAQNELQILILNTANRLIPYLINLAALHKANGLRGPI